jgi:hypothetical protein
MRTRLVHRYRSDDPTGPRRIAVNARALLVRDATGVWRPATSETLFPLTAVVHRQAFPDAELRDVYRSTARRGRQWTGHSVRIRRQATAFSVVVDSGHPNITVTATAWRCRRGERRQ